MRLPSPFLSQDPPITVWWRNSLSDGSEGGLWQPAVQMATIHVQRTQFSLTPSGPRLTPTCANGPKFASFPCGEQPRLWADDTWHDVRQCTEHTHPWILVYCEPHHSNKLTEVINRFYHLIFMECELLNQTRQFAWMIFGDHWSFSNYNWCHMWMMELDVDMEFEIQQNLS